MKGLNNAAGAQKQQGFEKSMGYQVKQASRHIPGANGQEHVAHLTDGGISQDAFDILLNQGGKSPEQYGDDADTGNDGHQEPASLNNGKKPHQEIDTGRNHGGGVNKGGYRRGAGHGIREPDGQGKLCGLADCRQKQKKSDDPGCL